MLLEVTTCWYHILIKILYQCYCSFKLDTEAIQGMLPEDAPPSLVMLALQCCEYSAEDRPYSDDAHGR